MKLLSKICFLFFLIFLMFQLLLYPNIVMNCIYNALILWSKKIVPSLLPFLLLSNFLMDYGLTNILGELLKPLMRLFKANSNGAFVFIISLLAGSPSNAFFANELVSKNLINCHDATKILTFSHFSSPIFILGTVYSVLNNKRVCILILIITYITNIILGILFRNIYSYNNEYKLNINKIKTSLHDDTNFGKILSKSIHKTADTLLLILGTICFFSIISISLKNFLLLSDIQYAIVSGILEMTQGINNICLLNLPLKIKAFFVTIFISFGGLGIHSQILSIISNTKIKYLPYLIARILHAIISGILVLILI